LVQIIGSFLTFTFHKNSVATRVRCGGTFSAYFFTRLLLNSMVKKIENRSTFGKVMDKSIGLL